MGKRTVLAGVLATIGMFLWSWVGHDLLPLGHAGWRQMSNEQSLLAQMHTTLGEMSGLYMFPSLGVDLDAGLKERNAAMQQYPAKLASNPSGLIVYHPAGAQMMSAGMLTTEFLTELAEVFLTLFLLAQTNLLGFSNRVGFFALAGVLVAISTNIPYWNWFGFPGTYTAAQITLQIVAFIVAGLIAAAILRPRKV